MCLTEISNELSKSMECEFVEEDDGEPVPNTVKSMQATGRPISVVFMDNIMIKMHGPQTAQILRNQGFSREIIGITGQVADDEVENFIRSGANFVLSKPMTAKDLKKVLVPIVERDQSL